MKRLIDWINRTFRHVRDTAGDFGIRTFLHIPVGFIMGISPIPGDKFVDLFIFYERNEDRWTRDQAWKDVNGALIGFALGRLALLAGIGYLIWRLLLWLLVRV